MCYSPPPRDLNVDECDKKPKEIDTNRLFRGLSFEVSVDGELMPWERKRQALLVKKERMRLAAEEKRIPVGMFARPYLFQVVEFPVCMLAMDQLIVWLRQDFVKFDSSLKILDPSPTTQASNIQLTDVKKFLEGRKRTASEVLPCWYTGGLSETAVKFISLHVPRIKSLVWKDVIELEWLKSSLSDRLDKGMYDGETREARIDNIRAHKGWPEKAVKEFQVMFPSCGCEDTHYNERVGLCDTHWEYRDLYVWKPYSQQGVMHLANLSAKFRAEKFDWFVKWW